MTEGIMLVFSRYVSLSNWSRRPEVGVSQRNCKHDRVTEAGPNSDGPVLAV